MALVKPFSCLRPTPAKADKVASVPYDVVDTAEARSLAADNPDSFLHIVRSEIDLPDSVDPYASEVYQLARRNLSQALASGTLIEDQEAAFYIYRLKMGGHTQTGIVACSAVADYDRGVIRIHEQTRQEKEDDRVRHILETKAHTEPVFLTFRSPPQLSALVSAVIAKSPLYDFVAPDGIAHTVWKVDETYELERTFQEVPCTYVADGHHRAKSASRVCAQLVKEYPNLAASHPARCFLTVLFPHDQLRILPYNRVIKKTELSVGAILERIEAHFSISGPTSPSPERRGEFSMFLEGNWRKLSLRPEINLSSDPVESLDVSVLQKYLLEPVFGILDPRRDQSIGFVGGIRGTGELEKLVVAGAAKVAFSLYPVPMEDFLRVAEAGKLMPPKSTWFEPKLRSGLFVHCFE